MEYRIRKDEYEFKECIFCGNKRWNLSVNFNLGVWRCWACNRAGKISQLRALMPGLLKLGVSHLRKEEEINEEESIISLEGCKSFVGTDVEDYLRKRGFTVEDGLRWEVKAKGGDWIVFPLWEGDKVVFYVEKNIRDGRYSYPKGVGRKGIVWVKFRNQSKDIVLVEGVFDAMRVYKAGFNVMVLCGTDIFDEEVEFIRNNNLKPVLFLDGDVGWNVYEKFSKKLGKFDVILLEKGKDPGDLSVEEIREMYERRKEFGLGDRCRLIFRGEK